MSVFIRRSPKRESSALEKNLKRFQERANDAWKLVEKLGLPKTNYGLKVAAIYTCLKNGADFNKYITSNFWNLAPISFFLVEKNSKMVKAALREKVDGELRNIAVFTYELVYGG